MSARFVKIILAVFLIYVAVVAIKSLCHNKLYISSEKSPTDLKRIDAVHSSLPKYEIVEKVREMNGGLESIRTNYLSHFKSSIASSESSPSQPHMTRLREDDPEYFKKLENFTCAALLTLVWNNTDDEHLTATGTSGSVSLYSDDDGLARYNSWLFHTRYYRFTADKLLCQWIVNNDINHRYGYVYNYTCNTDIKLASIPTSFNPLFLNCRSPSDSEIGNVQPSHRFEMPTEYHSMQIFTNSVVSNLGEPFCDNLHVVPHDCLINPSSPPSPSSISAFPCHKEVFVISQRWGEGYFHRMIENIPRTAFFLEFLLNHSTIKILAYDRSEKLLEILESLGIARDRVISGWTRSDIAYVPRSTSCGTPNLMEMQFFQYYNTMYIRENLLNKKRYNRDKLILIERTKARKFADPDTIEKLLNETSYKYGFEFVIFRDDPAPSLNETMLLFHLASVVVAPHGAGLSNLVYSRAGTLVIEGLCQKPLLNLCYHRTSYALGMRWHGIPALQGCNGVVDVKAEDVASVLQSYLQTIPPDDLKR